MTVTIEQIRMALGALDWKLDDWANATGLSSVGLSNIRTGTSQPQKKTMDTIIRVFEEHGIEFIHEGVRRKPEVFDILTGSKGLRDFFDGVHDYTSKNGGTIMMFGIDETTFIDTITTEFSNDYLQRMTDVSHKRGDLEVLAILCEGDTNFCAAEYNKYRWISKDVFHAVPFYIYGETLAIMDFETTPGPTIVLLKSRAITNAYRKQFQAFWDMAHPAPVNKKVEE